MAEAWESLLDSWVEEHKKEMIEELGMWVNHPSVSRADLAQPGAPFGPDCRKMLDFALERGRHFGFGTEDYEGYCGAITQPGEGGEIGIVAHLDVVPEGDHWICKPYEMAEKDGFLIGRGVGDNKGSAIMGLFLMRFFKENNIQLKNRIRLMLGCSEETGMADFEHYVAEKLGPLPQVTLVPDAAFPANYAQKGGYDADFRIPAGKNIVDFTGGLVRNAVPDIAFLTVSGVSLEEARAALAGHPRVEVEADGDNVKIIAHGKAGHAASPDPEVQNSAIIIAADAAVTLEQATGIDLTGCRCLSETFPTAFGHGLGIDCEDEPSGKLTINAGIIRKEGDKLVLTIDIRFPVTAKGADLTEKMSKRLAEYGAELVVGKIANPSYTDVNDPKVQALMAAYREITGDTESQPYSMGGGTYSRAIPNAITFGLGIRSRMVRPEFLPVGHGGAHGPDETLNIENWLLAFKIYAHAVAALDRVL